MRMEMKDLTVIIPVRIETLIRLENLLAVVKYLQDNFVLNIFILEAAPYKSDILQCLLPSAVDYIFVRDEDPVFYRTRYINQLVKKVKTKYLGVWDADVVFPVKQVCSAMEMLRLGIADFVYPYDGLFLDTSLIIRQMFIETMDVSMLLSLKNFMSVPYGVEMKGGAFLANREKYIEAGMENENFYGWGPEDWERVERWRNLGCRIKNTDGVLFHLTHPRDMNGKHNSEHQRKISTLEKDRICFSSAEEIKQHLNLSRK